MILRRLRGFAVRLASTFGTRRADAELHQELESHLQLHIDEGVARGLTRDAARREAWLALGGVDQTKERYRDRRGLPIVEHLARDVRFAVRTLRRSSGFTSVAVLTLALGIGANTAIFSVVNAVLLRPLPFPYADRLALVWATNTKSGNTEDVASFPDFEDWRAESRRFQAMAAFTIRRVTPAGAGRAAPPPRLPAPAGLLPTP